MNQNFKSLAILLGCGLLSATGAYGLRKWKAGPEPDRSGMEIARQEEKAALPAAEDRIPECLRRLASAAGPWEEALELEVLGDLMRPETWAPTLRQLSVADPRQACLLLVRWLDLDPEAALAFVLSESKRSRLNGRWLDAPRWLDTALLYLVGSDPAQGWKLASQMRTGSLFLILFSEHDPEAAAAFIAAHGSVFHTGGSPSSSKAGEFVRALCAHPDSLLAWKSLRPAMSQWTRRDSRAALEWWRAQSPEIRGRTLSGLADGLKSSAVEEQGKNPPSAPLKLSPEDVALMSETASQHLPARDREVFYRSWLRNLSRTDPVSALRWAGENLHGRLRATVLKGLDFSPEGALEVITSWDQLSPTLLDLSARRNLTREATTLDPAKTFDWLRTLSPSLAAKNAPVFAEQLAGQNPEVARRLVESLPPDDPLTASLTASISAALMPGYLRDPFRSGPPPPLPDEVLQEARKVIAWVEALPQALRQPALQGSLQCLSAANPAAAAAFVTRELTDPTARETGLDAVALDFLILKPEEAATWAAAQLNPVEREQLRDQLKAWHMNEPAKAVILEQLDKAAGR